MEQEVARQLQRVGSLQAQLLQVHAAAGACQSAAAMREAELMAQVEDREASLQAAQVRGRVTARGSLVAPAPPHGQGACDALGLGPVMYLGLACCEQVLR